MSNPLVWLVDVLRKGGERKRRHRKKIIFYNSITLLVMFVGIGYLYATKEGYWPLAILVGGGGAVVSVLLFRWSLTPGP
jgi:hypothetical protein